MSEYRIDIKVRNNVILNKLEDAGYKSVGEFCRLHNVMKYASSIGCIINMTQSPLQSDGKFRTCILFVADKLNCDACDLFTDSQMKVVLKTNKRHIKVNEAEMKYMLENTSQLLLEDEYQITQRNTLLEQQMCNLLPREKEVLKLRFGLEDGQEIGLYEIGQRIGVSIERVRQIEAKAIRKMRNPINSEVIRQAIDD